MSTCRKCGDPIWSSEGVKYGVRHYMHHACYLDAGKSLDDLSAWQIGRFPYQLLRARNLLDDAAALIKKETANEQA